VNIKKQIRFLYRYLTTSRRWRSWINTQVVIVLVLSAIFIAALAWSTPSTANSAGIRFTTASVTQTLNPSIEPTKTPFPPEYYSNSQQTVGITLAGVILVLIVVIGVIVFMPKKVG
jgi:hypothetical protein